MERLRRRLLLRSLAIPTLLGAGLFGCDAPLAEATQPRSPKSAEATRPLESGLVEIQGTTVLRLTGSDRDRGRQEGYLRGAALQELFDGWALKLVPKLAWDVLVRPTLHARFDFPQWARERAAGLIEGMRRAGQDYVESERLGRALEPDDILAIAALIDAPGMLCSSLAVWGEAVQGGGPIVARNLDYGSNDTMLRHVIVIVEDGGPGRSATVSVGWSSLGITTGVSEAGAFVSIHDVPHKIAQRDGHLPRILALQELLRSLRPGPESAESARQQLAEHAYAYGGNAMLAWRGAAPGAAVLEFGPAEEDAPSVTLRESGDAPWIACTNHFRGRSGPRKCRRYKGIAEGIAKGIDTALGSAEPLGPDALWDIVGTARVPGTLHTVMYDFATQRLRVDFRLRRHAEEWRLLDVTLGELLRG